MKDKIYALIQKLTPYWGMFYFAFMLIATHFIWKWSFTESLSMGGAPQIWLWQWLDCSAFFDGLVDVICRFIDWCFSKVLGIDGYMVYNHHFYAFEPVRTMVSIVWSCTGMKQLFIFTMMLLCYPKAHVHKLWAIPAFGAVIFALNIVRLMVLLNHNRVAPQDFAMWHEGSKYVFYAIMFGLWVLWEEISLKLSTKHETGC